MGWSWITSAAAFYGESSQMNFDVSESFQFSLTVKEFTGWNLLLHLFSSRMFRMEINATSGTFLQRAPSDPAFALFSPSEVATRALWMWIEGENLQHTEHLWTGEKNDIFLCLILCSASPHGEDKLSWAGGRIYSQELFWIVAPRIDLLQWFILCWLCFFLCKRPHNPHATL